MKKKNEAAVKLGRLGGQAVFKKLGKEHMKRLSKKGVNARKVE